jgi:hypothetical protein
MTEQASVKDVVYDMINELLEAEERRRTMFA